MATSVESIYSGSGDQIYPQTSDEAVTVNFDESGDTLADYLTGLEARLANISGAESLAKSLSFDIKYTATDASTIDYVKAIDSEQWGENFQLPTTQSPYIWKCTTISFAGQSDAEKQKIYEVVTADTAEISQTLYMTKNNYQQPTIVYPQQATGKDGENEDNVNATLDDIITESNKKNLNNWSKTPTSVTSASPYGYIAVRTRLEGSWSRFEVALNAKWAYDSIIVIKYMVTSDATAPSVSRQTSNPGNDWQEKNSEEFTGYLWMITATSSNNSLVADSDNNIWSSPQLISVVK